MLEILPVASFMKRGGFTLIEMLITVALILVMYVMLYGSWTQNYQEKQKQACRKNLQLIHVALQIYAGDNRDWYPFRAGAQTSDEPLNLLVPKYTSQTSLFICPGSKDKPVDEAQPIAGKKISYAYYMGRQHATDAGVVLLSDRQVDEQAKVEKQLVFSPDGKSPGNNHRKWGGNLLRNDGEVESSGPQADHDLPLPAGISLLNPKS